MAGVQISGLVSGMNWTAIISEIIEADSVGMNQVKQQENTVNSQKTALSTLSTDMTNVENDVYNLEEPTPYDQVSASSLTANSTWGINAEAGTPVGNYTVAVSQIASSSQVIGGTGIAAPLSGTADVSGVTLATMPTATAVTAGNFTVDGAQVAVTTSESLQDVFNAISTATNGAVTASYDPTTDKVTLSSSSGPVVLGADNDTSNFLSVMGLLNNGTSSVTSANALGAVQTGTPLAGANLSTALTGLSSSGAGSFSVNGVTINYNANTDSLATIISDINNSSAGVTAQYDAVDDVMIFTNNSTGNTAVNLSDTSGNLLAALGATTGAGATQTYGQNAEFAVDGGPTQTSASNVLTSAQLGISGLNVTVDSTGTQTIQVTTNTSQMATDISDFINDFNTLENDITAVTQISTVNGSTTTSLLSSQHEVGDWGSQLEMSVFGAGSGVTGAINSLDAMGIGFNGTTADLEVTDTGALSQAMSATPSAVEAFFATAKTGFGSIVNSELNDIISQDTAEQSDLQSEASALSDQVTVMQNQLTAEQQTLETEFQNMESMEAQMQTEEQTLDGISGSTASSVTSNAPTVNIPGVTNNGSSSSSSSSGSSSSGSSSSGSTSDDSSTVTT